MGSGDIGTAAHVAEHVFRYGHDALNNLVQRELVSAPGGSPMPRMLSGAHIHGTVWASALGPRQLGQVVTAGGTHAFGSDAAGRLVTMTPPTGPPGPAGAWPASALTYDAFDRLRVAVDDDGVATAATAHVYGADGQRTATRWPATAAPPGPLTHRNAGCTLSGMKPSTLWIRTPGASCICRQRHDTDLWSGG